jgi:hypothetical protein
MTLKEKEGYWKNGAWFPYKELVWNMNDVVLSDPVTVKRYPGKFTIRIKQHVTADEMVKWERLIGEDLEITESLSTS